MKHESPLDPLLKQISSSMLLSAGLKERLSEFTNIRYYPRQFVVLKKGEMVNGVYIMLKGLAHATADAGAAAVSSWFATEGHLLTPAYKNGRDIIVEQPVTVLEDSFIAYILYADMARITHEYPDFSRAIATMQQRYTSNQAFRAHLLQAPDEDRLRQVHTQYPGLYNRVEQARVAAFLDMNVARYNELNKVFSQ